MRTSLSLEGPPIPTWIKNTLSIVKSFTYSAAVALHLRFLNSFSDNKETLLPLRAGFHIPQPSRCFSFIKLCSGYSR